MRPTPEGKRFILATVLITAAAFNTANNLIYLILAMMLSILAVSYVLLKINLSALSLDITVPHPIYAKAQTHMPASIRNSKKQIGSYSLNIVLPSGIDGSGIIAHVGPESKSTVDISVSMAKRGVFEFSEFQLMSSFPFIFFTQTIKIKSPGEMTVYPELMDLDMNFVHEGRASGEPMARVGAGDELLYLRDHMDGEDTARIHWKASAKLGRMMAKEFSDEEPRTATIVLDDLGPTDPVMFERAVSYAASVAGELLASGFYVGLITCQKSLPLGMGEEQLFKIMDVLAVAGENTDMPCPEVGDIEGFGILILKSEVSALKDLSAKCDRVVYASRL